jgi:hypothetical protein
MSCPPSQINSWFINYRFDDVRSRVSLIKLLLRTKGLFTWRRVTRQGELLACRRDKRALCLYGTELLGICRMIVAWRRNSAETQKGFKSFEMLENIIKCRQNTRISAEKFRKTYLSIRRYFWAIIFQMQSTYIPTRAAELPGQSVYMENICLA